MNNNSSVKTMYRKSSSNIPERNSVIFRKSRMYNTMNAQSPLSLGTGVASSISHKGVTDIRCNREKEKKELQDLNERFANYIEKVRFLEAENKTLREALKKSKRDFNIEPIKAMYQAEIDETKKLLDDSNNENGNLKARIGTLEDELEDLRAQLRHVNDMNDQLQNNVDTLNDDISRRIADCEMLRRKVQELEKQLADWKTRHGHLDNQLQGLRIDLQEETAQRLGETNRAQALEEELAFLREICENEIKEYKALLAKDSSVPDMREYWTSELGSCLKEIRQEYEGQLEALSSSLEARYESQLCEMRLGATKGNAETIQMTEENRRLRAQKSDLENKLRECDTQISQLSNQLRAVTAELEMMTSDYDNEKLSHKADVDRLNAELEGVIKELQELMDAKLSLELEIAAYRKLLEGEESRISLGSLVQTLGGFRSESEDILATAFQRSGSSYQAISSADDSSICPASQGRITIHRTSAGSVSIMEVDATGQYIELEEISSAKLGRIQEPINLKGWSLERTFEDTKKALVHQFKEDFLFSPNKQIKVWGSKYSANAEGIVSSTVNDWGPLNTSSRIVLKDENSREKAVLNVKYAG
ncbi:60 kDa neurofilament protein [Octopus sinensis]|uniref:60 kDa neurofilament protein n=1 Tax=Octopus sinensis TaxID=2607531 RepID=A0A6P7TDQ7_9MOLL|nr:60 kDa neurofilament protein [Octopus sinensis]